MKYLFFNLVGVLAIIAGACTRDEAPDAAPAKIGFAGETFVYHESDGYVRIPVSQSSEQFSYTRLSYFYEFLTTPKSRETGVRFTGDSVYLLGGYTRAVLDLSITDDAVTDGNDTIELRLALTHGNAVLDPERSLARLIVIDDDGYGTSQLNIHAKWYGDEGPTKQSEVDYDLDLFLLSNVVISDNGLESYDIADYSAKLGAFEDIFVKSGDPDKEYYVMVYYNSNTRNKDNLPIEGRVELSGFGYNDQDKKNYWTFDLPEVGWYTWKGPFKKQGSTFVLK